jgi:acylaminoacyl-peptidase
VPLLTLKGGVSAPQWSPDDKHIVFLSAIAEEDEDPRVKVISKIPIWFNAVGFTYNLQTCIHMVDVYSGNLIQLTRGEQDIVFASLSNKGDKVAYIASTNDLNPRIADIFILDILTNECFKLTNSNMTIESLCWSPNDKYIAFRGHDLRRGFSTHETIWTIPCHGGNPEDLTKKLDRGSTLRVYHEWSPYQDLHRPVPIWSEDYIYFPLADRGRFNLYRLNFNSNEIEPLIIGDFVISDFSVVKGVVAYTKTTETNPSEVWIKDEYGERRITGFNDELLSKLEISVPERFEFIATDGKLVEGWIMKPLNYVENRNYPAILNIHGGPKNAFGHSFMFEHQLYASEGFTVIYVNPRGSDGYSEEFADIRGAWGERDFKDIMEAVDYISQKYKFLDVDSIGVTGISYGGFMTNWIITHTKRFKAAVSQNGISNLISEFGFTDIGFYFNKDQMRGDPWSNEEEYRNKSPLTYAKNVETPTMFIHSLEDYRCGFDQSLLFFTALKYLGKKTELVLFTEGEHSFSHTGKPSLRIKRLELMLKWFRKYLHQSS